MVDRPVYVYTNRGNRYDNNTKLLPSSFRKATNPLSLHCFLSVSTYSLNLLNPDDSSIIPKGRVGIVGIRLVVEVTDVNFQTAKIRGTTEAKALREISER